MATDRDDSLQSISVRLDGKNYTYWSYVMRNFLIGKKMWGYVCGVKSQPVEVDSEKYEEQMEVWQVNNSKIITWINNSVDNSIGMRLAKYDTAKQVWDHLERLYTQSNFAKQYQLEMDIRTFQQKDMSIQDFYSAMTNFWDQLAMTESAELRAFPPYIALCEEQRLVQFLMALRDDFEALRDNILHRSPKPTVDTVVSELIVEELRLKSGKMKGILPSPNQSVLVAHSRSIQNTNQHFQNHHHNRNQNRPNSKSNECNFCHQPGHWKAQCPLLANKGTSSSSRSPPPNFQSRHPRPPNTAVVASSPSATSAETLLEQLQKLLNQQPHAMSVAAGSSLQEADWDRP